MKEIKAKSKTYYEQLITGNIKSNLMKTLSFIRNNSLHIEVQNLKTDIIQMKRELNMSHQTLTATISMLEDYGLVKVVAEKEYDNIPNSYYSVYKFVSDEREREVLMEKRHQEKFQLWISKGIDDFREQLPSQVLMALSYLKN